MNILFVPIIKTKSTTGKLFIEKGLPLFSENVIPYIEIIKNDNLDPTVKLMRNSLTSKSIRCFVQVCQREKETKNNPKTSFKEALERTIALHDSSNETIVIGIKTNDPTFSMSDVRNFIFNQHSKGLSIGLRIDAPLSFKIFNVLISFLNKNDYLFIDIGENTYESVFFLNDIKKSAIPCPTIVITQQRNAVKSGKSYPSDDFDLTFNMSVLDAVQKGNFNENGFGSYCSAKNDWTEHPPNKKTTYCAVFPLYVYSINKFYIIRSAVNSNISSAYSTLKPQILANYDKYKEYIENELIANNMLNEVLKNKKLKGNASAYIAISIIQFVEAVRTGLGLK